VCSLVKSGTNPGDTIWQTTKQPAWNKLQYSFVWVGVKYCYILGFRESMTYAFYCISMVTWQCLLHNNEFVAFP
jgi:hypothetical protein